MKRALLLSLLTFIFFRAYAQYDLPERSYVNEALAPFYHGVASGDATTDKVIIWTRITTDAPSATVKWRIAKDSLFSNIVDQGTYTTDGSRDFTVKVDVQDLEPGTWYFYEFEDEQGRLSPRGRTKTIPTDLTNFRIAQLSCASYPHGFFNVYDRISERNDIDAVFFLGDYIYEYGLNEYGKNPQRKPDPENDIVSLSDYRTRYSQARLDTMLQKIHQQYTFYNIWDDHEFADNSWRDGANNHDPNRQGSWNARKSAALQAYYEWVPIREVDPDNKFRIYRSLKLGDLAEVFFLDTRIIARDYEKEPDGPNKRLIGEEQMEWLQQGLKNSTAKWKIIAQQVMMSPLTLGNIVFNTDQWDGYSYERKRLFDFINENDIKNIVTLTGDIHTFWAYDMPFATTPYNPVDRSGSAGVEFVTSAVTSPGFPIPGNLANILGLVNPFCRFVQIDKRGFIILDIRDEKVQGDYYYVPTINKPEKTVRHTTSWYTLDQSNHLDKAQEIATAMHSNIDFVPRMPRDTSNHTVTGINEQVGIVMGAYPNPFISTIGLQYYVKNDAHLRMQIFDMSGKMVLDRDLGIKGKGLYYDTMEAGSLPSGQYRISVTDGRSYIGRNIVKIE